MTAASSSSSRLSTTPSKPHRLLSSTSQILPHGHLDYVHDIAFDYYGRRFATASGDRTVRVFDLNPDGLWISGELGSGTGGGGSNKNEWVAARGAVRRVCWSHPEFGQLLATAGAGELNVFVHIVTFCQFHSFFFATNLMFISLLFKRMILVCVCVYVFKKITR